MKYVLISLLLTLSIGVFANESLPVCSGTPRFPVTHWITPAEITQLQYARTCDAFGVCTAWSLRNRLQVENPKLLRLYPDHMLTGEITIQSGDGGYAGGIHYTCTSSDYLNSRIIFDNQGNFNGAASFYSGYRCPPDGGSGGPYGKSEPRLVNVKIGENCLLIEDKDPSPEKNFGTQIKIIYLGTWF